MGTGGSLFATYLGATAEDTVRDVVVDQSGNVYVTGGTASGTFPTTSGAFDRTPNGSMDVFVAKFSPQGQLLCSTLLGGPAYDRAYAIELDPNGDILLAGRAGAGFPTTSGVVQAGFAGDVAPNALYGQQDGFVAKLSGDCSQRRWATYFGTDGPDFVRDLAVDRHGNLYLAVADVSRPSQHLSPGAFQTVLQGGKDGLVAKLSSDGQQVLYATYLGGSGEDGGTPSIRVDASGQAFFLQTVRSTNLPTTSGAFQRASGGGLDFHLARLAADGRSLLLGTYVGGAGTEFGETHNLALDASGNAYVAGNTSSTSLPATSGAFQTQYQGSGGSGSGGSTNYPSDGFVAKIGPSGALLALSYFGGSLGDGLQGVEVASSGDVYLAGATFSSTIPGTSGAFQSTNRGAGDGFAAALASDLRSLRFFTYAGGSGFDQLRALALGPQDQLYVGGHTDSANFPASPGAFQTSLSAGQDALLVRLR